MNILKEKRKKIVYIIIFNLLLLLIIPFNLSLIKKYNSLDKIFVIEDRSENINNSVRIDTPDHETIGWVRVQGTNIDYPLYGVLKQNFDYPIVSDSYLWSLSYDSVYHNHMLVFGHNVMNLSPTSVKINDESFVRMEELLNFAYYDFIKDNRYMQLTIDGNDYLYEIFSVCFLSISDINTYSRGNIDYELYKDYFKIITENSIYDFDVKVSEDDDTLSIVTCNRIFGENNKNDFIITGKMIKENTRGIIHKVYKNKNYDTIKPFLEGDAKDE